MNANVKTALWGVGAALLFLSTANVFNDALNLKPGVQLAAQTQQAPAPPKKIWIVVANVDGMVQNLDKRFSSEAECKNYMIKVVLPQFDFWSMDHAKCEWRTEAILNFN